MTEQERQAMIERLLVIDQRMSTGDPGEIARARGNLQGEIDWLEACQGIQPRLDRTVPSGKCVRCYGEGRYASPLTNWDSVPCDRCDGTGEAGPLVKIGEAIARRVMTERSVLVELAQ